MACSNICSPPFGLSNATQTFQRMIDHTTDGLEGVFADMDDSRVGSPDRQTHLHHLEAFFKALAAKVLQSTWKNVCLQHFSKFLATRFRRQERPPRPIAPPKSKIAHPLRISNNRNVSQHGKLLPPFSAQVCTNFETFN